MPDCRKKVDHLFMYIKYIPPGFAYLQVASENNEPEQHHHWKGHTVGHRQRKVPVEEWKLLVHFLLR